MARLMWQPSILQGSTGTLSMVLIDDVGGPFLDTLDTLTLTYYDRATKAIINGREDQDALNTANVSFGLTLVGTPMVQFIAATKVLRRLLGDWGQSDVQVGTHLLITGTASNDGVVTVERITAADLYVRESLLDEASVATTLEVPGKIVWHLQPEDTVVVDARRELEEHVARFGWTWDTGAQTGYQEVLLTIENISVHS